MRMLIARLVVGASLVVACGSEDASPGGAPSTAAPVSSAAAAAPTDPATTTSAAKAAATTTAASATTTAALPTTTAAAVQPVSDPTADRPYEVFVPSTYTDGVAMPLLILLHGYTASGAVQEGYFQMQPLAESRGFLYVHPDGLKDRLGNGFWNATDACCQFGGDAVDDVAYITTIIEQIQAKYTVDPKRIYLVGHSNGGFMSYRLACDRSATIAAIVSLAGATLADQSTCTPSEPVSVLQVHGTADGTISYDGGQILGDAYPGAQATVAAWAAYDGCSADSTTAESTRDIDGQLTGDETSELTFEDCPDGIDVELWTIEGGSHIPGIVPAFSSAVVDFLLAHPKP